MRGNKMNIEINKEYIIKLTQSDYDKLCSELFDLKQHTHECDIINKLYDILHSQSL